MIIRVVPLFCECKRLITTITAAAQSFLANHPPLRLA
jgi:hypothetical protein